MERFLKPKKLNVSPGSSIGHVECPDDIGIFCSGPVQPRIGVTFPIDSDGRKFSPEWYRRFTWLEYSHKRDAAFCYVCRHFAPSSLNNATFALKGYRGWKRALGDKNKGLELHCRAANHLEAVCRWEERKQRASSQNTVIKEMVSNNVYERRRYYVRAIAEVIKFMAVNELSFRGDYDKVLYRECGLFTDLFDFIVSRAKYLQEIINEIPANATYKSPDIQNDVIDIMAKMVTQIVFNDVNGADVPHATLLSDGTPSRRMDDFVVLEPTGQYRREEATATSQMLNDVIDNVLVEMTRRFTDQGWLYKAVTAMSRKSDKFLDAKTLSPLSRLGIVIPSNAELQVCKAYIERLNSPVEESDSNKVLKLLYEHRAAFPDTYAMAASIATLGSSSAVCEASFSTLARINNSHRRSMTHIRQRNLVLLAFEENRTKDINFDEFIKMFMPKHSRLHL